MYTFKEEKIMSSLLGRPWKHGQLERRRGWQGAYQHRGLRPYYEYIHILFLNVKAFFLYFQIFARCLPTEGATPTLWSPWDLSMRLMNNVKSIYRYMTKDIWYAIYHISYVWVNSRSIILTRKNDGWKYILKYIFFNADYLVMVHLTLWIQKFWKK